MFDSFFLGGFECATGHNRHGQWIDLVASTWHDRHVDEDYRRLREVGIRAARDAIRWPLVDRGDGRYDFSSVEPIAAAARKHRVCVVWDLFHYGYPAGLDPLSDDFRTRFVDYCRACARYLRDLDPAGPMWFTPVNEPSFFAWAAGHDAQFPPYLRGRDRELKVALVHCALRAVEAIREEIPGARFLHVDPICHVVPADDRPESMEAALAFNTNAVFESLDMLCGRLHPELGGSPAHLDVVGINHYWTCQWELGRDGTWLSDDDPRRLPLRDLVSTVWARYGTDIVISETAHWGEHRAGFMHALGDEIEAILDDGIPLRGVCLYPILGMCEWHEPEKWMPMGLWDIDPEGMERILHRPMFDALRTVQRRLESLPAAAQ